VLDIERAFDYTAATESRRRIGGMVEPVPVNAGGEQAMVRLREALR